MYEEARELLLAEIARTPDESRARRALSLAEAGLGLKEEAISNAQRVIDQWPLDEHPFFGVIPLENLAMVYTAVGEPDLALDILEQLLTMPSITTIPMLELDPRWEPLRGEERYRELKEKFG